METHIFVAIDLKMTIVVESAKIDQRRGWVLEYQGSYIDQTHYVLPQIGADQKSPPLS